MRFEADLDKCNIFQEKRGKRVLLNRNRVDKEPAPKLPSETGEPQNVAPNFYNNFTYERKTPKREGETSEGVQTDPSTGTAVPATAQTW